MDKRNLGKANHGYNTRPEEQTVENIKYIPVRALNTVPANAQNVIYAIKIPVEKSPNESKLAMTKDLSNVQIFTRITSVLFVLYDVIQDWFQFAEIGNIDSKQNHTNARNWARGNIKDYFSIPDLSASWNSFGQFNFTHASGVDMHSCGGITSFLSGLYFGIVTVESLFSLVKIANVLGETLKDSKLNVRGFQIMHGWTESVLSLFFEDLPQTAILFLFINSCKRNQLSFLRIVITISIGFTKNIVRSLSCRQKSNPCCSECLVWGYDFGCPPFCPWLVCCTWYWCGRNKECCSFENKKWEVGFDIPLVCSCGRWVCCGRKGLGADEGKCCTYQCFSCFKDKDDDPLWAKRFMYFGSVLHIAAITVTVVSMLQSFCIIPVLGKCEASIF